MLATAAPAQRRVSSMVGPTLERSRPRGDLPRVEGPPAADHRHHRRRLEDRASATARASAWGRARRRGWRSEEHTSELQSLMRNSYAVFCLKKKKKNKTEPKA